MPGLRKVFMGIKMGFSVLVFVTIAAFGSSVAVAWRAGGFTLPILVVLVAIGAVVWSVSAHKEKEWLKRQSEAQNVEE